MKVSLTFRPIPKKLPTYEQIYRDLWRFAKALEGKAGFSLNNWHPPAPNENESLTVQAFDESGPTAGAITLAERYAAPQYADMPHGGVWNGKEGDLGASFKTRYNLNGLCNMEFRCARASNLRSYDQFAELIHDALRIWPGLTVEVAPPKYSMQKQVFPDRPGIGWMLYLPGRIEPEKVPEAPMLRYVKDLNGAEGTIIISVIDEPFDVDNAEHVRVANALEIRLADQGLLPRYADL